MPAHPSSRMPSCLRQLGDASGSALLKAAVDLRKYLATVPDPRARRGIRYPLTALLTAAAAAVLAGAVSLTAIGELVADAPQRVLALLGFRLDPLTGLIRPPHATTVRLVRAAADSDALDRAIGNFLQPFGGGLLEGLGLGQGYRLRDKPGEQTLLQTGAASFEREGVYRGSHRSSGVLGVDAKPNSSLSKRQQPRSVTRTLTPHATGASIRKGRRPHGGISTLA
ncbi:transposase family protein [Streptomyces prasinus]|uniref:transposase family protein n=1 Tax=Streptomyces prasinus TaxID=67345 RepID=UPI0037D749A8